MRTRWLIGGLVVLLAAAALLTGQLLMTRRHASQTANIGAPVDSSLQSGGSSSGSSGATNAIESTSPSTSRGQAPKTPAAPQAPAAPGERLTMLAAPPVATAGGFNPAYLPPGSRYAVIVRPYGFGPSQGPNTTLVVEISSAKGLNGAKGAEKLVGRNALVIVEVGSQSAYTVGGSFSAVLTLKPDSRGSVLVLSPPSPGSALTHPKK